MLRAYEYRSCVCGFDLRIGNISAGLEAAHIQWFTADGPDVECNGMAMCSLHHKIFDLGAFTVEPANLSIVFSQNLQLGDTTRSHLLSYHGAGIIRPQSAAYAPQKSYLDWHAKEVFKGDGHSCPRLSSTNQVDEPAGVDKNSVLMRLVDRAWKVAATYQRR